MNLILLGMAIWSSVFMVLTTGLGIYVSNVDPSYYLLHLLAGITTTIFVVLTHSLVFIHLEGSGRSIKDAVRSLDLDPAYIQKTKTFKRQASPPALYAMLLIGATAILGAWAREGGAALWAHAILVALTLAVHVWAFPIEIRVADENADLIEAVEADKLELGIEHEPGAPPPTS